MTDAITSEPDSRSGTIGLLRNTGWNLAGQIVPLFVAVFTIPGFMRHMGTDRFGVLTIAWSVLAYFSLFDFGLGRAVTVLAAEKIGANRHPLRGQLSPSWRRSEFSQACWRLLLLPC